MTVLALPPQLVAPLVFDTEVALKVQLNLTIYPVGPSDRELDKMCDIYERVCPPAQQVVFRIDELDSWSELARPELTTSGKHAAATGVPRPYFEASRVRIRNGRAFCAQLWDQREIDDPSGSWS